MEVPEGHTLGLAAGGSEGHLRAPALQTMSFHSAIYSILDM